MLLYSHVSRGIFRDFPLSGTSAEMFNKHQDPFAALWLFLCVHPYGAFRSLGERRGEMGRKPGLDTKLKERTKLN